MMKTLGVVIALLGAAYAWQQQSVDGLNGGLSGGYQASESVSTNGVSSDETLAGAYRNRTSNLQVQGGGVVTRVLSDDNNGSRHQRFILRLESGQTLLIAHNIDLAPRITAIRQGDRVEFFGEYEWNSQGGVIHWTHHDPQGRHVTGWLRHRSKTYQ